MNAINIANNIVNTTSTVVTHPKTRKAAATIVHYIEYAFWLAALGCYLAGKKTGVWFRQALNRWYEEAEYFLKMETLYIGFVEKATEIVEGVRTNFSAKNAIAGTTEKLKGGLKATKILTAKLLSNIREGMFPHIS